MDVLKFTAIAVLGAVSICRGQTCTQGTRSIEQAVRVMANGDLAGARTLLERAEKECPTSFPIFRDLARKYRLLGDTRKADECDLMANRLDPRNPGQAKLEAATAAPSAPEKGFVREKWALVVGVGSFQKAGIPKLDFAAKDAADFAQALKDPKIGRFRDDDQHVRVLLDKDATLANIKEEINYISKSAREEDLVVFYFSSHGTSAAADASAKKEAQTGYIVTHDTDTSNLYGTAFPMEEMKKVVVDRVRARRVVTFLDTCFSGDTIQWAKGGKALSVVSDDDFQGIAQGSGRVVVVSSRGTEQSWEGQGNSYFTKVLIDALSQKGGLPTITEVFSFLQPKVSYLVKKEKSASQTPQMWPEGLRLDIVIGTPIQ